MYCPLQIVKNRCLTCVAVLLLAGFSSGVSYANFQYNYIQAAYVFGEFDFGNADVGYKGYEVAVQFEVSSSIVAGVNYLSLDGEDTESSVTGLNSLNFEGEGFDVYLFYYSPVTDFTNIIFGASYDMTEFEAQLANAPPALQTNDDTKYLFAGVRHQLQGLEVFGQWSHQLDTEDNEDRWSYTLGLLSGNPGELQLGFSISPDNDGDVMSVFVRQSY